MSLPTAYNGPLDRPKMPKDVRIAYEAFCGLKARSKKANLPAPTFSAREFLNWWFHNLSTFKGTVPTCGRIDHSRGYSWDNMFMQDMRENSREGLLRNKGHIKQRLKNGQKVLIKCPKTKKLMATSPSIRCTAELFDVSQRLIQFLIRGKYKTSKKIPYFLEAK